MIRIFLLLLLCLGLAACGKKTPPKPIVHVPIVETHPFDDGYNAGYAAGKEAAHPRAPLPKDGDVLALADEEGARAPDRNEKWRRGFIEGYTDGFRRISTGSK